MKTGTLVLIAVGGLIAYKLAQLGTAAATFQVELAGVDVNGPLDYVLHMSVQNISNGSVDVKGLTGSVFINDNFVGSITDFQPVVIPGVSQQNVDVHLRPSLLALPGAVVDLLNNSHGNLTFRATGNANVDSLVIPFSTQTSITI